MLDLIIKFVRDHQGNLYEYQLLKHLELNCPKFFDYKVESFSLYQKHFLLFNALYQIDDMLKLSHESINISPLNIEIGCRDNNDNSLAAKDHLREFYLDINNLQLAESEINRMLSDFWSRYKTTENLDYYLKLLKLDGEPTINMQLVRRNYNQLALELHPDRGGSAPAFSEISIAYQQLKQHYR